jgi:hypothetical protein
LSIIGKIITDPKRDRWNVITLVITLDMGLGCIIQWNTCHSRCKALGLSTSTAKKAKQKNLGMEIP